MFNIADRRAIWYTELRGSVEGNIMRYIALLIITLATFADSQVCAESREWYEAVYDSLAKPRTDQCLKLEVADITFECDRARFALQSGKLYFFPQVAGRMYGCMFSGTGRLRLDPPTNIERFSLKKHLNSDSLDLEFTQFRMMASPKMIESFFDSSSAVKAHLPGKLKGFLRISDRALNKDDWNIYATILGQLAGNAGSFAWIDLNTNNRKRYVYTYNNLETEPVVLYKRTAGGTEDYPELILSCFEQRYYKAHKSWKHHDQIRLATPLKYSIDAEITEQAHLRCKVTLDFISKLDSLISLYALIFEKTDIDSVLNSDGQNLFFSKLDKEPGLTVFFDSSLSNGDTSSLTFFSHSKEIISKSPTGDFFIGDQVNWYPIIEYLYPSLFDVSFRCPKQLTLVSVGDKVADSVSGDTRYTRWVTNQPELFTSFNYGLFDTLTLRESGIPTVEIYRGRTHRGDLLGSDMKMKVGLEVAEALKFYTDIYGPIPYDPIRVTEIPFSHGQGMPGLLHLAWQTFQDEDPIWDAQFRAHEVAHQWWGHVVRWESYHDQWMSEAFSEFSSAWYVQTKLADNKKYFEILEKWRKDVVQKGVTDNGRWSEGTEAGPIWLGWRLSSSKSQDYMTLVYSKGAYVMHMLRCMMRDWAAGSDDRFIAMMRDFVQTYYRKPATMNDFQKIAEKHIHQSMEWFFDQWICGIHVPKLEFKKKIREYKGMYIVDFKIMQEQVPEGFTSFIPIMIKFKNDSCTVVTVVAIGRETHMTPAPFRYRPEEFDFNYYKGVLAR